MRKITVLVLLLLSIFTSSMEVNASSTGIIGPEVIHKERDAILTISDILSFYHSTVGLIQVEIDNFTGYGNIIGEHQISLFATNGEDTASKLVNINVIPSLGNVLAVTDYKNIFVHTNQVLTPSEIVGVLENTGYIEITSTTQMMLLANTYTENAETPGQYFFEFRLVNSAGVNAIYSSTITVLNEENPFIPDIIFEAPPSAFDEVWNFIKDALVIGLLIFVTYHGFKIYKKSRKKVHT